MLTNVMSLVLNLVEVKEFINQHDVDLACMTETWLRNEITDSIIHIPNYTIIHHDRQTDSHGGVCLYIRDNIGLKFQLLDDIKCCDQHEILWVHLKPKRLPRGFSCNVLVVVYHPRQSTANDNSLQECLFDSLTIVEAQLPSCTFIICGDFNHFNILILKRLKSIEAVKTA